MKTPKYDVLLPTLFVSVIFPAAAGGWWRFFSGHADQIANPMVHSQSAVPAILEEESQLRNSALVAHPIGTGARSQQAVGNIEFGYRLSPDRRHPEPDPNEQAPLAEIRSLRR